MLSRAAHWFVYLALCLQCCNSLKLADSPSGFASADPNDPKYVIAFASQDAAVPDVDELKVRTRVITQADGSQYRCFLPLVNDTDLEDTASDLAGSEVAKTHATEIAEVPVTQKTPFELLERAEARCLFRQEGLWTYEMCFRKHLRQFRQDDSKDETFVCGNYLGDEEQSEEIKVDASASGYPFKYVSHVFGNGSKCHLTGQERSAEVRFTCLRDVTDLMITGIKEFPTCNYIVTVSAPFLCSHPEFKPKPDPLRLIGCYPLQASRPPTAAAAKQLPGAPAVPADTAAESASSTEASHSAPSLETSKTATSLEGSEPGPPTKPHQGTSVPLGKPAPGMAPANRPAGTQPAAPQAVENRRKARIKESGVSEGANERGNAAMRVASESGNTAARGVSEGSDTDMGNEASHLGRSKGTADELSERLPAGVAEPPVGYEAASPDQVGGLEAEIPLEEGPEDEGLAAEEIANAIALEKFIALLREEADAGKGLLQEEAREINAMFSLSRQDLGESEVDGEEASRGAGNFEPSSSEMAGFGEVADPVDVTDSEGAGSKQCTADPATGTCGAPGPQAVAEEGENGTQ